MDGLKKIIISLLMLLPLTATAVENSFYILRNNAVSRMSTAQSALASLNNNSNKIGILIPQAYQVDNAGIVWGQVDPITLKTATAHNIKIMPMITNAGFDTGLTHQFLSNPKAQQESIATILGFCKKNKFYGVQFDFEMIALKDRDALTEYFRQATNVLHQNGFKVSYAVAPIVSGIPQPTYFLKRLYVNWQGAYDLKKLGEMGDFLSVMAYNQHEGLTTPGPTASYPWVETAVKYALQYVPANKIVLALPSYSNYWYTGTTGKRILMQSTGISYEKAEYLIRRNKTKFQWDDSAKNNVAMYDSNWLYEYVFEENAKSFYAKYGLVKKYNLRGMALFDLGTEDPGIWKNLPNSG